MYIYLYTITCSINRITARCSPLHLQMRGVLSILENHSHHRLDLDFQSKEQNPAVKQKNLLPTLKYIHA